MAATSPDAVAAVRPKQGASKSMYDSMSKKELGKMASKKKRR
jgi:hypothetical protein